jgi:general secretion pathway protein D
MPPHRSTRTAHRRVLGWCRLALLALTLGHSAAQAQAGGITLNLKDADIRTLIETVSEATGRNFVIDPRVKAKVTVVSSRPMSKADLYQVFLSILQVHGYSAVQVGDVTKIVPDVNAKQGPVPVAEPAHPGTGDELVTRVIKVENVPAAQLVPILRPLIPQQGHLAAYAASNTLVVSDRAANVGRIIKIIQRIDVPDSQEIEVIPLEHASATELVRIITALNQKDAKRAKVPGQPILAADERTNSVLLGGDRTARLRIRGLIAHLDTPLEGGGNTQVVFLKFADAEELAPVLLGVAQQQAQVARKPAAAQAGTPSTRRRAGQEIDIQADARNNALIITASPAQFNRLRTVIQQLDIRRAQVLVESIIAEVNIDLSKDLGVEFAVIPTQEGGASPAAVSNAGAGTGGLVDIANSIIGGGAPFSLGAGLFVGAADLSGSTRWAILVRALAGDAATNILSTPTLVTMDNEEAQIVVGQNVPFITGSFTQTGTDATNPFQTIERQDVGLTLNITPQINEGNTIKLVIEQETSSLSATAATLAASDLITNTRTIKTTVLVENDQILVLGGLIQDEFQDTVQKTPVLGDIPILGRLFRFDSTKKTKKNLMVFIHPVILHDEATANAYTNRKYGYIRAQQLEAGMHKRGLIKEGVTRLPDLDDLITTIPETKKRRRSPHDPDEFLDITP